MLICPESPRWLARQDRWDDAEKVLVHLRTLPAHHSYVRDELSEIRQQVEQRSANRMTYIDMFKRLVEKGVRNRIMIGLFLMACQNLTGVNIITYCRCEVNRYIVWCVFLLGPRTWANSHLCRFASHL